MIRCPLQNLMLIAVFYQILLFILYPILLVGFKLGDEVLDLLELGDIFIGQRADGYFVLDDNHEC